MASTPRRAAWRRRARVRVLLTVCFVVGLLAGVVIAGCGATPIVLATPMDAGVGQGPTGPGATVPSVAASPPGGTVVAHARADLAVFAAAGDAWPAQMLPATTASGAPTVVLVTAIGNGGADGWFEVVLPLTPNGSTGWVRAGDVELHDVALAVSIDAGTGEVTVRNDTTRVLTAGTVRDDTCGAAPTGRFYIVDAHRAMGAGDVATLRLSAAALTITGSGDRRGGVGTGDGADPSPRPGSGTRGPCLLVSDRVIARLVRLLPLGTPVTIS